MTTQDKEAVEAAYYAAWNPPLFSGDYYYSPEKTQEAFLAGVEWQKQREKPVNGELEGDD